jgi:hypothetical protein
VTRTSALAVSAIHFAVAPGVVVALVPWWLTGWQAAEPMPVAWPLRVLGTAMVAAATVVLVHAFARVYEEPALHRQFGAQYEAYRQHVPGWLPRTHPWQPGDPG